MYSVPFVSRWSGLTHHKPQQTRRRHFGSHILHLLKSRQADFCLHVRGDGDVRVAWDVGFPGLDAPWSDEAQERAAEGVWSRVLKAEVGVGGKWEFWCPVRV